TNQQVSDFHTTEGSVNGSLTDQHYAVAALLFLGALGTSAIGRNAWLLCDRAAADRIQNEVR
ncbi:hypothetical protein ACU6QO_00640, partial [Aeromonas veronii]|uniref:hypothetical protein n=1 Tax=Aeromonas veronii TaxID=654 RepID=UPI00406D2730